ncbi:hypothetical protein, partial [Nocardia carnea]|uniref:hypothetical protein n=1 Tax=Nocardia carnea TaxID=37328 RepID=UPI00245844D3
PALATTAAAATAQDYLNTPATPTAANDHITPPPPGEIHTELRHHLRILADALPALTAAFDIPPLPGAPLFAEDYLQEWATWAGWDDTTFPSEQ